VQEAAFDGITGLCSYFNAGVDLIVLQILRFLLICLTGTYPMETFLSRL